MVFYNMSSEYVIPEGYDRASFYGVSYYPTACFDGKNPMVSGVTEYEDYLGYAGARRAIPSPIEITARHRVGSSTFSVEADVRNVGATEISGLSVNFTAYEDLGASRLHYIVRGCAPYQTITLGPGEEQHLVAEGTLKEGTSPSFVSVVVFAQLRSSPTKEVLQARCCSWEDLPYAPTPGIFNRGWNWFSLPGIPNEPEASAVFGHDMTNLIFKWDKVRKGYRLYPYDFTNLEIGEGYILYLHDEVYEPSYTGSASPALVYIDIPEAGALFVGCPHYANTLLRLCRVRNKTTNEYRSAMTDSRSADPWLNWNWVYFDSKEQQAKICALSGGDDEYLRPWYGYRVWAYVPNIELRILGPG